jgi:hypothetical protein
MVNLFSISIGDQFWLKGNAAGGAGIKTANKCYQTIQGFISCILPNIYVFAGIILFILLLVGGIGIIKSANGGSEEDLKKGQQAITSALIGFLLIFASYWIIQLIQIISGVKIFNQVGL